MDLSPELLLRLESSLLRNLAFNFQPILFVALAFGGLLDRLVQEEVRHRFTLHLELTLTLLQAQLPRAVNAGLLTTVRQLDQQAQV